MTYLPTVVSRYMAYFGCMCTSQWIGAGLRGQRIHRLFTIWRGVLTGVTLYAIPVIRNTKAKRMIQCHVALAGCGDVII